MDDFSEKLKRVRRELNLTQKEIANIIGVSDKTVYRWENKESIPSIIQRECMAIHFGLRKDYFYSYEEVALLAGKYMSEVVHPKCRFSFYKIWISIFLSILCLVFLCFSGMYVYYKICTSQMSKYGRSSFTFSFKEFVPYLFLYFFIFIIPIIVHEIKKYLKERKGEKLR